MALTRRTNFRKAMLAPWHPLVEQIWLYTLAWAQHRTDVAIHQSTLVLNHHHTEVTASKANLPDFKRILHGEVSKALNTLLASERYDQPRQLWDDRRTHAMRLIDAEAQAAHMVYSHVNCVAAGLVRTPSDMPCWTFDFGLWKTGVIWIKRPDVYFDPLTHPEYLPLRFTPSPLLYRAFNGDLDGLVHHMRKLSDDAVSRLREARKGRPVIGARRLQRIHPWNEPRTLRESGGEVVPTFKIGARCMTARTMQINACIETKLFRSEHRDASVRRRGGEDVLFPNGTYWMRVQHGVRVADVIPGAIVNAPGPTLDEVKAELAERGKEPKSDHRGLLERVRAAFKDEASDMAELDEMVVDEITKSAGAPSAVDDDTPRSGTAVRHRFGRDDTVTGASRVVVLRDHRRGRPPRSTSTAPPD
jgi:putative transposase